LIHIQDFSPTVGLIGIHPDPEGYKKLAAWTQDIVHAHSKGRIAAHVVLYEIMACNGTQRVKILVLLVALEVPVLWVEHLLRRRQLNQKGASQSFGVFFVSQAPPQATQHLESLACRREGRTLLVQPCDLAGSTRSGNKVCCSSATLRALWPAAF
jgi:hypothetical protein